MKSTNVYSALDAKSTHKDALLWLAVTSRARFAVHAMKLAVIK